MRDILVYRNKKNEIELWTIIGKGFTGDLWAKYRSKTPKEYAKIEAKILKQKPYYGPCWWGMGEDGPKGEFLGVLSKDNNDKMLSIVNKT